MRVSYDKLWNLMRANKMRKGEMYAAAKINTGVAHQLNNDEPIHMKYMMNLCKVFNCDIGDLVEVKEINTKEK